jgi:hypothetical protein
MAIFWKRPFAVTSVTGPWPGRRPPPRRQFAGFHRGTRLCPLVPWCRPSRDHVPPCVRNCMCPVLSVWAASATCVRHFDVRRCQTVHAMGDREPACWRQPTRTRGVSDSEPGVGRPCRAQEPAGCTHFGTPRPHGLVTGTDRRNRPVRQAHTDVGAAGQSVQVMSAPAFPGLADVPPTRSKSRRQTEACVGHRRSVCSGRVRPGTQPQA